MKQVYLSSLLTMLISMIGTEIFAHDLQIKNADGVKIYYNWIHNENRTELEVTYPYNLGYISHYYSGNVVIPESVELNGITYRVTSIGNNAFGYCSTLTSVTIPNRVTSIVVTEGRFFCYMSRKLA